MIPARPSPHNPAALRAAGAHSAAGSPGAASGSQSRIGMESAGSADGSDGSGGSGVPGGSGGGAGVARFNLLLTYGGWQHDSWADRLPTLLGPLGVQCWRASAAKEAADLLKTIRFHLAVVDLRLPLDGVARASAPSLTPAPASEGGSRVLDLLKRLDCPPPTLVVRRNRSSRDDTREMEAALRAGAFAVIDQPVDLELMLKAMGRALERFYKGRWPCHDRPQPPPNFV